MKLPILHLAVREQRYSCHSCGNCCRDFTVQLRSDDLAKLEAQQWETKLGQPVTIEFRGVKYLRQRDDGGCVFLMENGLCRVHAEYGFTEKPIACQLFPFHLTPSAKGVEMGINFACQSVVENKGAELRTHQRELLRMSAQLPEIGTAMHRAVSPPMLTDKLRASQREVDALVQRIDRWLCRSELSLPLRLDGLAWVISSLAKAKHEHVREQRFVDLLDVLFGALPEELAHHPIPPPTKRQQRMLRQAAFARTEDPKMGVIENQSAWRFRLSQLLRSHRFKSGRGIAPTIGDGWPKTVGLERIGEVSSANDEQQIALIDDLMTRYMRASVLGSRCWGAGYYGWNIMSGLQALVLNAAVIGWLARLHAAGKITDETSRLSASSAARSLAVIDIGDVRAALGRVDRTAGRAKWLGSVAERLRLAYLSMDDGLRRVLQQYDLTTTDGDSQRGEIRR